MPQWGWSFWKTAKNCSFSFIKWKPHILEFWFLSHFLENFVGLKFYLSHFFVKTFRLTISTIFQDMTWPDLIAARVAVVQLRWNFADLIFSQLKIIMGISTKIQRVVFCDQLMSTIRFSSKLVKIAYLWRSIGLNGSTNFNF